MKKKIIEAVQEDVGKRKLDPRKPRMAQEILIWSQEGISRTNGNLES